MPRTRLKFYSGSLIILPNISMFKFGNNTADIIRFADVGVECKALHAMVGSYLDRVSMRRRDLPDARVQRPDCKHNLNAGVLA